MKAGILFTRSKARASSFPSQPSMQGQHSIQYPTSLQPHISLPQAPHPPTDTQRSASLQVQSQAGPNQGGAAAVSRWGPLSKWPFRSPCDAEIFANAFPFFITSIVDPLVSTVDLAVVSRVGIVQAAGYSIGAELVNMSAIMLGSMSALASTSIASSVGGSKSVHEIGQEVSNFAWLAMMLGAAVNVALFVGAKPLLGAVGADAALTPYALQAIYIRSFSSPINAFFKVSCGCLRGLQDTRSPLYGVLLINVVNLVLDLVFVFGFGWEVKGAASATLAAQVLGATYIWKKLAGKQAISLQSLRSGPPMKWLLSHSGNALLLASKTGSWVAGISLGSMFISQINASTLTAHAIARQLWFMLVRFTLAFGLAQQVILARFFGANDTQQAWEHYKRNIQLIATVSLAASLLLVATRKFVLPILNPNPAVYTLAMGIPLIFPLVLPIDGMVIATEYVMASAKRYGAYAYLTTCGGLMYIGCLVLFQWQGWMSPLSIYTALLITDLVRLVQTGYGVLVSNKSPFKQVTVVAGA